MAVKQVNWNTGVNPYTSARQAESTKPATLWLYRESENSPPEVRQKTLKDYAWSTLKTLGKVAKVVAAAIMLVVVAILALSLSPLLVPAAIIYSINRAASHAKTA